MKGGAKKKAKAKPEKKTAKAVIKCTDSAKDISEKMAAPKRRSLKSRTTEEQVDRVIQERFRNVPKDVLESKVCRDGQLLRPKLLADFRRSKRLCRRLGANYWRDLEAWFSTKPPLEGISTDESEKANPRFSLQ